MITGIWSCINRNRKLCTESFRGLSVSCIVRLKSKTCIYLRQVLHEVSLLVEYSFADHYLQFSAEDRVKSAMLPSEQ